MEIISRELDANLILMIYSLKKNFNVFLGDSFTFRKLLDKKLLASGIVLTKSVTHGKKKSELHDIFRSQNFKLTSIDHEHGVLDTLDYKEYFAKSRIDKKELEKLEAFFCWGSHDYKNLNELFPTFKNKFFITGSHRVDAWRNIKKYNGLNDKKKISIFTNFAFSNNRLNEKKIFSLKRKAGYYKRCSKLFVEEMKFLKYQKKLIKKFVEAINYLVDKLPEYNFYVKPHPSENVMFWYKNLLKKKNLEIIDNVNSTSLIKCSDLIIQTRCTTSVEAIINKVNHINYIPVKSNHGFAKFVDQISHNAKNKKQLLELINLFMSNKVRYSNFKSILNKRIICKTQKTASEKISSTLYNLCDEEKERKVKNYLIIKLYLFFVESIIFIKKKIYNMFYQKQNIGNHKFEGLEKKKIVKLIERYSRLNNFKSKIKVSQLGKKLLLFEN